MAPSLLLVCGCKDRCFLSFTQIFSHFSHKKCTRFRILQYLCTRNSGFSAVGSALRSGRRGRWFESSNPDCKRKKVTILFSAFIFYVPAGCRRCGVNMSSGLTGSGLLVVVFVVLPPYGLAACRQGLLCV